jgi:ABC-type uncharacterized transport system involved in gliding motility auxiliary subunit
MVKKSNNSTTVLVVGIAAILILLNLISLKGFLRLDLTRDRKFTLSEASVETVRNLPDILTVNAYFTDNLPPPYAQHARYVKDLLEEYLAASDGKFAFQFIDPAKEETSEDKAKRKEVKRDIFGRLVREPTTIETELAELGLQPVEIRVIEDDQQQTKGGVFMGFDIQYQEKHEVIPVVQNLADLEKDMTSLMRKLTRTKEPKLGLIKDMAGPHIEKVSQALRQNMVVVPVDLTAEGDIADDVDAILVAGSGEHFGEHGAEKIDKFLRKGKSAAVFLDRIHVDPRSFQAMPIQARSKTYAIIDLLKGYGLDLEGALVADAACASLNMQENRGGFVFSLPVKYPFVPELMNLSYDSPITKGLSGVILPFVASLTITPKDGLKVDVLARSSKVSWLEKEPFDLNPRRNWGEAKIEPDGPHTLLVQARGSLPTINNEAQKDQDAKAPVESRLVVMGTSAFMWDEFLSPANQVLALNVVDWMLADSALLAMRAREFTETPLDADLSDMVRQTVKFGNILGVPFLLVLYGLIRWRLRESRRRALKFNR